MFIREVTRFRQDRTAVRYVQLVQNERDPKTQKISARILYSFGRRDELDIEGIRRLITSLSRFLSPEEALKIQASADEMKWGKVLRFVGSRTYGGGSALNGLWEGLGIRGEIEKMLSPQGRRCGVERCIFAMVASRALSPMSKLGIEEWVEREVSLPGVEEVKASCLYRAMDFLLKNQETLERRVFETTATLLNLEVDVLFFDTTSTYFEIEEEDEGGIRHRGYSRDHRADLPQVLVGLVVTREGIPVKVWVWPGETSDKEVVTQVKRELTAWRLGRVVWAMDRGMVSEENAVRLQEAGHHFIMGEKSSTKTAQEALGQRGRFKRIEGGLMAKEIVIGRGEKRKRYVVVYSLEREERDRQTRERILKRIKEDMERIGDLKGQAHTRAACALVGHRTLGRYVQSLKSGRLRLDRQRIREDAKRDGKYVLWTSDDTLPIRDIVLGYKKLSEVERAWRDLKHRIELRPIYHRKEDRIRSHVLLCWLALLLIRTAETRTRKTWFHIRPELESIHIGRFDGSAGHTEQVSELSKEQEKIFKDLKLKLPQRYLKIEALASTRKKPQ